MSKVVQGKEVEYDLFRRFRASTPYQHARAADIVAAVKPVVSVLKQEGWVEAAP